MTAQIYHGEVNPHHTFFPEFSFAEMASGGPDPQVELTARATDDMPSLQAAKAIGCFVVPYTCGSAAALWYAQAWDRNPEQLRQWIIDNKDGIPIRRERRTVWGVDKHKFIKSMLTWNKWCTSELPKVATEPYPEVYASVTKHVQYFGRYATMKAIQALYLRGLVANGQSDIRPRGAEFPRRTLALLFPDDGPLIASGADDPQTLELIGLRSQEAREMIGGPSWFDLETLLCNYRQSFDGKYPGRSHDRELAHWLRAEAHFGAVLEAEFPFRELRAKLFPVEYLGEVGGWDGARKDKEREYKAKYEGTEIVVTKGPKPVKLNADGTPRKKPKIQMGQADDRIFIRGKMKDEPDLDQRLLDQGIQVVISLTRRGEPALASSDKVRYIHHEMSDGQKVDAENVIKFAKTANWYASQGYGVLIACVGGKNRSGIVTAATLIARGWSADDAIAQVQKVRSSGLNNEHFCAWLRENEGALQA